MKIRLIHRYNKNVFQWSCEARFCGENFRWQVEATHDEFLNNGFLGPREFQLKLPDNG